MISGPRAVEAFGRGWTRARGETDGFAWATSEIGLLRFPKFGAIAGRRAESVAWAPAPAAMIAATAEAFADEPEHWLVTFEPAMAPPAAYAAAGWHIAQPHYLMARSDAAPKPAGLARLLAPNEANLVDGIGLSAKLAPGFWDAPGFRLAGVFVDGACVAAGRIAEAIDDWVVIDGMATHPDHRGRGYGAEILALLLCEAAVAGRSNALLVASEQGRKLYSHHGFETLAACYSFARS